MKTYRSIYFLFLVAVLFLAAVACGGSSGNDNSAADSNTSTENNTNTEAVADSNEAVANSNEDTADSNEAVANSNADTPVDNSSESTDSIDSAIASAGNRATTMMGINGKPTPPSIGLTSGKEDVNAAPTAVPNVAPTKTPPPPPTATPQTGTPGIYVENQASTSICYIYAPAPDDDTWGDDLLGDSGTIDTGSSMSFKLKAGTYDLRFDDCNHKVIYYAAGTEISDVVNLEITDPLLPEAGNTPVVINNDLADVTACYIFIADNTSDSWGYDWLGVGQILEPDGRITFQVPGETIDLKAVDCDWNVILETDAVALSKEGFVWNLSGEEASAEPALSQLTIENNGDTSICYVQISLPTDDTWGPDWLGDNNIIETDNSFTLELSPDTYDMRALDCDQNEIKAEYGIDVTSDATWSIP